MSFGPLSNAIHRTLFREYPASADGQLLGRFVARQDQAAFEEIVRRHGPMVLQVCRRLLGHHQDAEDAFQATFLVLSRKAREVADMESVSGWLHGVACRTALNARRLRGRRPGNFDSQTGPDVRAVSEAQAGTGLVHDDLRAVLDEELARLPQKYRVPMVLCYLEGKSTEEAARQLGWPTGTVKTQMHRARELLRKRLTRRGMTLAAAALAVELPLEAARAALPATLLASTMRSAASFAAGAGAVPAAAAQLAGAVLKDLSARKLRWAVALLLALVGAGAGLTQAVPWKRSAGTNLIPAAASERAIDMGRCVPFRRAAVSTGDRHLALGDIGGGLTVYELDWGTEPLRLRKLPLKLHGPSSSLAFSPDGKKLAVGCPNGTVQFLDLATGSKLATLRTVHRGMVVELAFAPDGQTLAALVAKGGLTTWNLRTHAVQSQVDLSDFAAIQMVLTPRSEVFAIDSKYRVHCWDAVTGREKKIDFPALPRIAQPGKQPATIGSAVALAGDGSMVVAANDGSVYLWERTGDRVKHLFTLEPEVADNLNFMVGPRGDTVSCIFHKTNRVMIWDVVANKKLLQFERPFEGGVLCQAYSSDGKKFFWCGCAQEAKPRTNLVEIVWGIIDLDARRREIAGTKDP